MDYSIVKRGPTVAIPWISVKKDPIWKDFQKLLYIIIFNLL